MADCTAVGAAIGRYYAVQSVAPELIYDMPAAVQDCWRGDIGMRVDWRYDTWPAGLGLYLWLDDQWDRI